MILTDEDFHFKLSVMELRDDIDKLGLGISIKNHTKLIKIKKGEKIIY